MHPEISVNWGAIGLSVVVSYAFGFIWHGPLFGKLWMRLMGYPTDVKPAKGEMLRSFSIGLVGTILTAYVLYFSIAVWRPSVWGQGEDMAFYVYGFWGAFFVWLGFFVPMLLNSVAWERRSFSLFFLNATYHFLNLQILGLILAGCCI